jgi:hypothetical protein
MMKMLFICCLLLCSCTANRMVETDLYFGLSKPGGGKVSEQEWNSFRDNQINKVFKEGNTVIDAAGSWFDPKTNQPVTEPSRIVICLHKNTGPISKQIDSLRQLYKTMFSQGSVLRVDKKVKASF